MDIEKYVSVLEAMAIMGRDPAHIARLCRQGKLEGAIKIGRDWRIPRATAENYTPGPKGFAARPKRPTIPSEWQEVLSHHPAKKN